jgi:hypothetical protein
MSTARELASATPSGRDRYVDLLRVSALAVVMVGHFFMVAVVVESDGAVEVTNSLTEIPWAQWLTWVLQVMPVFFAVGGFSHAVGWASVQQHGGTYADFLAARMERLLRPTLVFVVIGTTVGVVVEASGHLSTTAIMILRVVAQPLWFIGIYLAVVLLAPAMLRLHRRWDWWVLVVLAAATALVDVGRLGLDAPDVIGYLNFAFVWLAVHQCGFFYADGSALRGGRRLAASFAVGGLALTATLVLWGPYPVSMVTLPGDTVSNMTPPSLALLTLSMWLLGLVLLLRSRATAWLSRPRVWLTVVAANGVVMTAFLWHLSAVVGVNGTLVLIDAPAFPPIGSAQWWLWRLPLLLLVAVVLTVVVAALRRFERPRRWTIPDPAMRRPHRDASTAAGAGLALLGLLGLSVAGFAGVLSLRTAELVVVPMACLPSVVLLMAGYWLTVRSARATATAHDAQPAP